MPPQPKADPLSQRKSRATVPDLTYLTYEVDPVEAGIVLTWHSCMSAAIARCAKGTA
jgi:hypothetical protein